MKNVAKCDTWCELRESVNHRVFEQRVAPKPLGGGTLPGRHAPSPHTSLPSDGRRRGRTLASVGAQARGWPESVRGDVRHGERWISHGSASRAITSPRGPHENGRDPRSRPRVEAGPPAEFKHIDKAEEKETYRIPTVTATDRKSPKLRIGRPAVRV